MRTIAALAAAALAAAAPRRALPATINAAYTSDQECDDKIIQAVKNGLNVVIWSFIELAADGAGKPVIDTSDLAPLQCIANISSTLEAMGLPTTHVVSVGGWGAPHPAVTNDPAAVYASWKDWNEKVVGAVIPGGFDGIDFDYEGANEPSSPINTFTVGALDTVGIFSQLAKADGYFVSLVPPESYLDVTTSQFSRSLLFNYPNEYPSFYYHGHNAYAYWLARYGSTNVTAADGSASVVPTYDWISIQLYESYSHALYNTTVLGQSASDYLEAWVPRVYDGWRVDFSSDPTVNWPTQHVRVNQTQLIVGLANGWTDGTRAILIWPALVCEAYNNLAAKGQQPRGFMFWDIKDEGDVPPGASTQLYLAAGLNECLHTRG